MGHGRWKLAQTRFASSTSIRIWAISSSTLGEALLAAQALDEGDPQRRAVEVLVAVDQVGLDQHAAAGLEGRPHADVDRRRDAVGEGRVDAVAGDREAVVGDDVGGREAELAAALVAARPPSPSTMNGAPRQCRAPSMSPAATRARIRVEETVSPSTSTSGTTRVSNSGARGQHLRVALGLGAEAEVLADRDLLGAELLDQDVAR